MPRGCTPYTLRTRRNGTARCPRTLPGLRACYRARRAQKTRRVLVRGSGSTMNRHTHTQPQKRAARDKRGPGAPHTHCRHTAGALRRPAREKRTARARLNLNATARTGQGPRTRHRLRLAGAVPFPLLTGGSAAPLSTATLLSTLEIGLGPSAARPPRRGAGRPAKHDLRRRGSKRRATGRPSTG